MGRPSSPPPAAAVRRIEAAAAHKDDAEAAFIAAVVDAIRAGGSIRTVADIAGVSTATVQRWLAQ